MHKLVNEDFDIQCNFLLHNCKTEQINGAFFSSRRKCLYSYATRHQGRWGILLMTLIKKSFYTITKGTALEQYMKLPRTVNAMAYTNLPKGKLIRSISTNLVGDGAITCRQMSTVVLSGPL